MMNRKKSSPWALLKSVLIVPAVVGGILIFSGFVSVAENHQDPRTEETIRKYLMKNLRYPEKAWNLNVEGTVYLQLRAINGSVEGTIEHSPREKFLVDKVFVVGREAEGAGTPGTVDHEEGMEALRQEALRTGDQLIRESGIDLEEMIEDRIIIPLVFQLQERDEEDEAVILLEQQDDSQQKEAEEIEVDILINKEKKERVQEEEQALQEERMKAMQKHQEILSAKMREKQKELIGELEKARSAHEENREQLLQEIITRLKKEMKNQQQQNQQILEIRMEQQKELQEIKEKQLIQIREVIRSGDPGFVDSGGLFILDGEVIESSELRKADKESFEKIEVITGDAAKALYGRKGENGIIMISTKKKKQDL